MGVSLPLSMMICSVSDGCSFSGLISHQQLTALQMDAIAIMEPRLYPRHGRARRLTPDLRPRSSTQTF